jgi:hypothetical protein
MNPTISKTRGNTYHRDGSVSFWNPSTRQWECTLAGHITEESLLHMSQRDRTTILLLAVR